MDMGTVVGEFKVGNHSCQVKVTTEGAASILLVTRKGSDLPINGSQVKFVKEGDEGIKVER